jgi:hypothetical protein
MCARLYSPILPIVLCASAAAQISPQFQPVSKDRSFKSSSIPDQPDDWEVKFEKELWAANILAIDPARSLMLSDCSPVSPWCGKAYDFESVFAQAGAVAKLSLADAAKAWYTAASSGRFKATFPNVVLPWKGEPQMNGRFQPLAIVNRMDLARYIPKNNAPGSWMEAEVRFVYGLVPGTPPGTIGPLKDADQFTIILEFQLSPRTWTEFRTLAGKWMSLTQASSNYLKELNDVIQESRLDRSPRVRLRMNRNLGGVWGLSQWEFVPKGFIATPLTDQINPQIRNAQPGTDDYKKYTSLWGKLTSAEQDAGSIPITDTTLLAPNEMVYSKSSLDTPIGMCNADVYTRNILGMQQCSFCHTNETGTEFAHIPNRPTNLSSHLSAFLTGNPDGKINKLSILQFWYAPDNVFSNLTVPYGGFGADGKPCAPRPDAPADRSFNDLARRTWFLAGVLTFDRENSDNAYLIQLLRTNFSH